MNVRTEYRWNDKDKEHPRNSEENLFRSHFIHHKSRMECLEIELGPPRREDRYAPHNDGTHIRLWSHKLLLLQSALQPLWVLACSTIVEYSQQEGFYRVLLPVARLTANLEVP